MSHSTNHLLTRLSLVLMTLLSPSAAFAQQTWFQIQGVATRWRLENYVPDNVVIWYSGSPCTNGQLLLPGNAKKEDRDRLFATASLSRSTNRPMFVYYIINGNRCEIVSFGMLEQQ